MPGRDGTGPAGPGGGGGRMGGPFRAGPEGYCECPKCKTRVKHDRATPCTSMKCPKCGSPMTRV